MAAAVASRRGERALVAGLAVALWLCACQRDERAAGAEPVSGEAALQCRAASFEVPRVVDLGLPERPGERLARLEGAPLEGPLEVALWLDFGAAADVDYCSKGTDLRVVALGPDRVLLQQDNGPCGGGPVCRVYEVASGRLVEPRGGCLRASFGRISKVDTLGRDWFVVYGSSEGVGEAVLAHYTPHEGQRDGLVLGVGYGIHGLAATPCSDGTFVLETACPLPQGCGLDTPPDAPLRRYRWSLETGAVAEP